MPKMKKLKMKDANGVLYELEPGVSKEYVDEKFEEQYADIVHNAQRIEWLELRAKNILYAYSTDSTTAYTKSIPAGALCMDIKSISGHSEVVDGELVSQYANIATINPGNLSQGQEIDTYYPVDIKAGTTVVASAKGLNGRVVYYTENKTRIDYWTMATALSGTGRRYKVFTLPQDCKFIQWKKTNETDTVEEFMLELGDTPSTKFLKYFEPYSVAIPQNCCVGRSVGSVADTAEYYSVEQTDHTYKYYCKKTIRIGENDDGTLYVLDTPIVTTIELSENIADALTVEGGGSVTIYDSTSSYKIGVPSTLEYLIALNEV